MKRKRFATLIVLALLTLAGSAHAQVIVNRLGTGSAGITFGTGTVVEVLPGNTTRFSYCVKSTVSAMCVWTPPSSTDTGPTTEPSTSVGYPLNANQDYCFDKAHSILTAITSRMDCYNSGGSSGTVFTREEQ